MLRIALLGYGRMGHEVEQVAKQRGHNVVLTIDKGSSRDLTDLKAANVDVAIDFSIPESAFQNVSYCLKHRIPVVSGTTGWNSKLPEAVEIAKERGGAFFYASNFSIGVNLFFKLNTFLAAYMRRINSYSIAITETHHIRKVDAPSGTAITLADRIMQEIPSLTGWTLLPDRDRHKIPIQSIREGEIPGTHIVSYDSEIDTIELKHTAKNRRGFALGAVLAAEFIQEKSGYFTMDDLLGV